MWATASRFVFTTTAGAVRAAPHALRFWASWSAVPGAVGLSVRYEPFTRAAWTLSIWRAESYLDGFLHSAEHRAVVRAFHHRLSGTAIGWEVKDVNLERDWQRARDRLTG